jgi:imidazolonepropionase-like amidohydrolase
MRTFVRCGQLFSGREDEARKGEIIVFDQRGVVEYAGAEAGSPRRARSDRVLDYSGSFVMPGLIDVHTHLAYGNAKSEEDIDLYSPLEFRTLRGMFFAQKVAAAGFTAICSPGDAGQISLSIRDAIRAGLFDGPRVMAAGRYVTTHQGLTDWYPSWIGAPETSIGKLVTTIAEAIEEIRRQVKDGVDCVKIALDGIQRRDNGELVAAFTQEETEIMVREIHRLGKKAVARHRVR